MSVHSVRYCYPRFARKHTLQRTKILGYELKRKEGGGAGGGGKKEKKKPDESGVADIFFSPSEEFDNLPPVRLKSVGRVVKGVQHWKSAA